MAKSPRQGEVRMIPVADFGDHETRPVAPENGVIIVGESETHHHHVLDADGVMVMERVNAPDGMTILHAIVEKPTRLRQTAGNPHGEHAIAPGKYVIRIKREFNPFAEQARRVAD